MPDEKLEATQRRAFGATVRLIRTDAGMTQEQLGHAAELARTYVGALENGERNPSFLALWRLAAALGVSPRSFFPAVEAADTTDPRVTR